MIRPEFFRFPALAAVTAAVLTILATAPARSEVRETPPTATSARSADEFPEMRENFWTRHVRKIHFDLHTVPEETELGRNFDAVDFADKMARSGTQAVVFFCRGAYGQAYHPSKVNTPHPHLKSDMFGDAARELDQRKLGVIGYFAITRLAPPDAEKHPDWLAVGLEGARSDHYICPSSAFWDEMLIPHLVEVTTSHPVGALWMDGVYHWFSEPCVCERCRGLFGGKVPIGPADPDWRRYDKFIQELVWEKLNRCAAAAHAANPAVVIGSDWVGSPMWAFPEPAGFDFNTGDIRFDNGPLNAAFAFACWTWRGKPADVNMQRTYWWQEYNTRGIHDLHREFAAALASCGSFMLGDTLVPYDCRVDEEQVRFYREAFAGTARLEPIVRGARPRADIALLISPEQLRVTGRQWPVWSPTPRENDAHYGVYAAIVEAGMTAHILTDADLPQHLGRYKALVVPEVEYVGSAAAEAIRNYVEGGGNLVLVGAVPAVMDADATWTKTAAADRSYFSKLAGIHVDGRFDFEKSFFHPNHLNEAGMWRAEVHRLPVGVFGSPVNATLDGAKMLAPLAAPGRPINIRGIPMGDELDNPAFSVHSFGEGHVWFAAQPLASEYWKQGWRGVGCALQELVQQAAGEVFARRTGGSMVQLFVTEKPNETALHLVAYTNDIRTRPGRQLTEPVTLSGLGVTVHTGREVASLTSAQSGAKVDFNKSGNTLTMMAPPFEIWETLVIQWK